MYFTRNNYFNGKSKQSSDGTNKLKIYRAKWLNNKWIEENLAINNDDFSTGHPALTNDEKYLVFSSDRPGGFGGSDLYFVSIDEQGNLGEIKNLGASVNTEGNEMFPTFDRQGRLFFASDGLPGLGGLDVFYCSSLSALNPQNLGEPINSPFDDFHLSLDSLGTSGYLSSNRSGGAGYDDIYSVKLLRPLVSTSVFRGIVKNETDGRTIDKSKLFLIDDSGLIVDSCLSGLDGSFGFTVLSDKNYRISASKEKFATTTSNSFIPNKEKNDAGPYEIKLRPISNIQVVVLIKDKLTQQPVDSVKLTATLSKQNTPLVVNNPEPPKRAEYIVALDGMRIGDSISLALSVERPGYLSQTVKLSDKISPDGIVPVTIFVDKIQVGADLSKIIDIKPIYFDLGKSNIRPDAAKELDKIVQVMNDNPSMVIELGSHTDCRSSASSNLSLSDRRAKASAEYIKKRITNPARITGKGYGESMPINDCRCEGEVKSSCSEPEHQLNRRTEFKIITF
jgi:outer membrane protein OmpA-like peptidoglycan-associated protein